LKILSAIWADLKACRYSRAEVALRLSEELGYAVSEAAVDAVAAETKANRMPAEWVPAWVKVTGSRRLLDILCADCGLSAATAEDREFAELGRHQLAAQKLSQGLWEKI